MKKSLCQYCSFLVSLIFILAISSIICAQEPAPSEWGNFIASSKNVLIPDTFRQQTFRGLDSDNWPFTLYNGASVVSNKYTLKLPVGSKVCFEPYSIDGYKNVSAWIRCAGLQISLTESLGFEWYRNGKQELKKDVYVGTGSKDWFGYRTWCIDNNPIWVNLVTYNAINDTKGYFMSDSVYVIGDIPGYSLFKGEGNWRDTTLWSNFPSERYRSALISGNITVDKNISCHNTSVSNGNMHVASAVTFNTQNLHLYDSSLSSEGDVFINRQVIIHHTFEKKGEWYFISFPFDVYSDQIDPHFQQKDEKTNGGGNYFYVQTYNGNKRSEKNSAFNNWEVHSICSGNTPVFQKNKGYLIALDMEADSQTLSFASRHGTISSDFAREGIITVSVLNGQGEEENRGWYLCGNPLPCPLPLSLLENVSSLDGNIYIYVEGEYKVYPLNSDFAIPPYSAFFVRSSSDAELKVHSPLSTKSYHLIKTSSLSKLEEPVIKETVTDTCKINKSKLHYFAQGRKLWLKDVSSMTTLTIYDLSGRILLNRSIPSGNSFLNLSLEKGIYILELKSPKHREQKKIIIL